jgi:tRNA(Ile)-lysidine synthase
VNFDKIDHALREVCGLDPQAPLLVGVSGGPDSLCLMDILHRLGWKLVVAHFDHGLRPESGQEAGFVGAEAAKRGLDFVPGKMDVGAFARSERISVEEAARVGRYRFLFAQANLWGAQAVAVAHSADDQVETVLMHLLRGTGLTGLKGMAFRTIVTGWDPAMPLVRPFLDTWREEILGYCADRSLTPVMDASNLDTTYFRNRLRHELIPILEGYNPQIKAALWRTAHSLEGDFQDLESSLEEVFPSISCGEGKDYVRLDFAGLRNLSEGAQRRVLRKTAGKLRPGLQDIDSATVERALAFIKHPTLSKQMDWISSLYLMQEGEHFLMLEQGACPPQEDWPQIEEGCSLALDLPGQVKVGDGWRLESALVRAGDKAQINDCSRDEAFLDADLLTLPLEVRPRMAGDRFKPLGMDGHSIKLSDFFINFHLPRRARQGWPLVCSGPEIAWVPRYRSGHSFRIGEKTRLLVHLRLLKDPSPGHDS